MRYPAKGGFKSFIKPLINDAKILQNHYLEEVDSVKKRIKFKNGEIYQYKYLLSTIPLPKLANKVHNAPEKILKCAENLVATSIDLVSIGFSRKVANDLWFYIYDEDIYASRAYSPSVKSSDNVPNGCSQFSLKYTI